MKNILFIIMIFFLSGCGQPKSDKKENTATNSPECEELAGRYDIRVKGTENNIEWFVLHPDCRAEWHYIGTTTAYGTFSVDLDNSFTVKVQGKTGTLSERYELKNGVYYCDWLPDRRLIKLE